MFPHNGKSPVNLEMLPNLEGVLDVIYNPARTQLLLDAEKRGLPAVNGLLMLVAQAKEASEWFTGQAIDDSIIAKIHQKLRQQMENIVLIGMPGCGKSTVGKALAAQLGKKFTDADLITEEIAGMPIPEIFDRFGEDIFRNYETAALSKLGMLSGLVIATGGGCVVRERNYPLLHQNSTIVWLKRNISSLPTDGRPLSQQQKLSEMYQIRKPLYEAFADYEINNDGNLIETINQVTAIREDCL